MHTLSHHWAIARIAIVLVLICSLASVCAACNRSTGDVPRGFPGTPSAVETADIAGQSVNVKRYDIQHLSYEQFPQGFTATVIPVERLDTIQGLPIAEMQGVAGYHPVQTAGLLLELLSSYIVTEEPAYLEKAFQISEMLLDTGVYVDGALYFPYTFDFCLHGDCSELMRAPWYSGMAQGMALSAFVRFYGITEDTKWLDICRQIFRSFRNLSSAEGDPWVVYVDTEGYYWIEEYPIWPPANTLNGFVFGIFGLYEYHLLVSDAETETLVQAAITTIERYMSEFRHPGHLSLYCLKHGVASGVYHRVHIDQLEGLYSVTGDEFFLDMAHELRRDTTAVILFLRPGWRETALSFLPAPVRVRIYAAYSRYQEFRQGRSSVAASLYRTKSRQARQCRPEGKSGLTCES